MKRKGLAFILLVLLSAFCFGQNTKEQNAKENEKKDFSESTPYFPRNRRELKKNDSKVKTSSRSDYIVYVPVFVYDQNNKVVADLKKSDFKLFIDDSEQEISVFETEEKPLDIFLIIDTSTSFVKLDTKGFAQSFVDGLNASDKVQIISLNTKTKALNELTTDRKIISKAIKKLETGGGTSLWDSIDSLFQENFNKTNEPKIVVILTDGVDTISQNSNYQKSLTKVEKGNALVFSFITDTLLPNDKKKDKVNSSGILEQILSQANTDENLENAYKRGEEYLIDIATLTGGKSIKIKNFSNISNSKFINLNEFLKPKYYLGFSSTILDSQNLSHSIKIRVNRSGLEVRARGSFSF